MPRVRSRLPLGPRPRLRVLLRTSRGRLPLRRAPRRGDSRSRSPRGRPACGATRTCCPWKAIWRSATTSASRRWCAPATSPTSWAVARCGSRTTPSATPRGRSRTAWCRSPSPRPESSASTPSPAPPPATWPTRWPPTRPRRRLKSYIFIPADLEQGKILATLVYSPTLVAVEGTYDEVNRLCSEIADKYRWAFVNVNLRPFYSEGSKSYGFEIVEQLGWRTPGTSWSPAPAARSSPRSGRRSRR